MTLANAMAKANKTFMVLASLAIVTYDRQNIFIVQAPGATTMQIIVIKSDC